MSIEIRNLSINVSISPKVTENKLDAESIKMEVLKDCRQLIDNAIAESKDR